MEGMIGWTFDKEAPDKFVKHVRKYIESEGIEARDIQRLLERAGQRWGTAAVNAAMRSAISKDKWAAYWHHRSIANDTGYYAAVTALRAAKLWVPAEKEEKHLTKYLKHPEWLMWEEHVRMLMYAKELQLTPRKKLTQYRETAYRLWGKSRVKWAQKRARLKPPDRGDGRPSPRHKTMNDLLPQALKTYIELSQQGLEPVAIRDELLALFRKRPGYTRREQAELIYRGEEVDYQHCCHGLKDMRSMPWDWIPCAQAIQPP
jgi:hypothetical protein